MRLGLISLPLVAIFLSCTPVGNKYKVAASKLRCSLTQVESNINIKLPISKTKIDLKIVVELENPTTVSFVVRSFNGKLSLITKDKHLHIGDIGLLKAEKLPAKSKVAAIIVTSIKYQDLANNWPLAKMALNKEITGSWNLSGKLHGEINGIPIWLPVKSTRSF
jgi:hypothetical protein